MRKFLLSLVIAIAAFAAQAQDPAVTMTTSKDVNSQFSFGIRAQVASTPIQIDWGNGVKENFTIGDVTEFFSYPLKGNTVKIWGTGIASLSIDSKELTALDVARATSLTYLYCKTNQLTALNLANCTALTFVDCSENLLTSLNLPSTSTLVAVNCDNNLLTTLNVSGATGITELTCSNNKLTFATLPVKQLTWTTYTYSPQQNIELPKQTYSTNEEIDLSSQLTIGSNNTTYTWKTASGTTLVNGTDYNVSGGKFTFLKTYTESLYCEMTNTTFPSLNLKTASISIPATPSVIMTTAMPVGSIFSFGTAALANNTLVQVDWGNGILSNYIIGGGFITNLSGTLTGNTIKIYGIGIHCLSLHNNKLTSLDITKNTSLSDLVCSSNQLTTIDLTHNENLYYLDCNNNQLTTIDLTHNEKLSYLDCNNNQLTTIDLSKNTKLEYFKCQSNKFTFTTLPIKQTKWLTYIYNPQAKLNFPKIEYAINEDVDLSAQQTVGGNTSSYVWKTLGGIILVKDLDYVESNGKFTFIKQPGDYFYCEMTNATFPKLTLTTENIFITPTDPVVTMTTTTTIGNTFSFNISVTVNNTSVQVDWGDGILSNYIIGGGNITNLSGTLTGNTVKIYGVGIVLLDLFNTSLTSLDVTKNTTLTYLYCDNNQLSTLDVSQNTGLNSLSCINNKLTTIDLTKNNALTYLSCDYNQLSTIDVSQNTGLNSLQCSNNKLTTIDVTKNTALRILWCDSNQLNALDVTKNTELTDLSCASNQLTALDVTNNTLLTTLSCGSNQLNDLDVTKNTALTSLLCFKNKLIALDVTKNISLSLLLCHSNQLNTLDVTNNSLLTDLSCSSNQLNDLDVTKNTALTSLLCYKNKLTSLDVTKNNALTNLNCGSNQLNTLDVTNNIVLKRLWCVSNQLTTLDVSQNTALNITNCSSNKLSFATLPINQATWTSYDYSPQAKISLAKTEYALNEEVDLSNQLTTGGNTTTYLWKTIGGVTLVKDVDYTESNGNFTFIKQPWDYLYCEMTNASFPNLTLTTENILITPTDPSVTMITTTAIGSTFSFTISSTANNTPILVDWGDGVLANYIIEGVNNYNLSGTLTGNTLKIYGEGINYLDLSNNYLTFLDITKNTALTNISCGDNQLTTLDVSQNTALTILNCDSNKFTFSTLPIKQANWTSYEYSPQAKISLAKTEYTLNEEVDLNNQLTAGGNTTTYIWKTTSDITLVKNVDYTENNGKFTFIKQPWDYIYCEMRNATFPDLTLTTENISVALSEPILSFATLAAVSSQLTFTLKANSANRKVNVDWGNGVLTDYTVGTNSTNITGTLASDTIKVYGLGITHVDVSNKNIDTLTINNPTLAYLDCNSNNLDFTTLPLKQTTWTTYTYSPQAKISPAKTEYALNEEIDLSNQLTAGSNTTTYVWKTIGGVTLVKDVDYTEGNGKFAFIKQPGDYIFCEMSNATFPDLTLTTNNISVALSEPILSFVTLMPTDSQLGFTLIASSNNSNVKVDWGNGVLTDYSVATNSTNITGTLAGSTVKVFGLGVAYAYVSNKKINAIELNSKTLNYIDCNSNNLTFSSLPLKQQNWTTYTYSPQNAVKLAKKQYGLTENVDLSSELTVDGKTTSYIWKTKGGATLTAGTDYNVNNGITTFLKVQTDSVYCQMTNATFPDLTLTTTNIKVSQFPLSVGENEVAVKVYPNPATQYFSVKMAEEIVRVEVYTLTGVKVFENGMYSSNKVAIPTGNMPKGILLVRTFTRNGVYESKVLKL